MKHLGKCSICSSKPEELSEGATGERMRNQIDVKMKDWKEYYFVCRMSTQSALLGTDL